MSGIMVHNIIIIIYIIVRWWRPDVYFTFNVLYTRAHRLLALLYYMVYIYNDMGGNASVVSIYAVACSINNLISSNLDTRHIIYDDPRTRQ